MSTPIIMIAYCNDHSTNNPTSGYNTPRTNRFTIEIDDITVDDWIWNFYADGSNEWGLRVGETSGKIQIEDNSGAGGLARYATTILGDNWYRIVVVLDDNEQKLYLNGILVGSGTDMHEAAGLNNFTSTLYIGWL